MTDGTLLPTELRTAHPFIREALHDRIVGALVGSALGDAIGLYTEFMSAATSAESPSYPEPSRWPGRTRPHSTGTCIVSLTRNGDWTDDTDHALLILLSFLHNGQLLPRDFAQRLKTWVDMGLRALDTLRWV